MNNSNKQCGCNNPAKEENLKQNNVNPKILNIKWQRLVTERETCPRCGNTEQELDKAIGKLKQALLPLGIDVSLEKEKLNISEFKQEPLQSNRIWINGQIYETIPSDLIIQAGLAATNQILNVKRENCC